MKRVMQLAAAALGAALLGGVTPIGARNMAIAQTPGDISWGTNLFSDRVARNVGDIVTVLVMESASSTGAITSDTKKDDAIDGGPGAGAFNFVPAFNLEAKNQHQGQATLNRSDQLIAKIPARVVEILPDGTLRLEGSREVTSNGERQILHITGLARSVDIGPDNTVASSVIADAHIEYTGKGVLSEGHRMSRFMRIFNWLF